MEINYCYVNPGGNPTLLVLDKIPRRAQAKVANKVMKGLLKPCEQVGFIEPAKNPLAAFRLQMMGGEFCGNAARAAGAYFAFKNKYTLKFSMESSGTEKLLEASAELGEKGKVKFAAFAGSVKANIKKTGKLVRVDLQGITQFVLPGSFYNNSLDYLAELKMLYKKEKLKSGACGLVFYRAISKTKFTILPIIYVKNTNTVFKETSCASASMALALFVKLENISVLQPSGG